MTKAQLLKVLSGYPDETAILLYDPSYDAVRAVHTVESPDPEQREAWEIGEASAVILFDGE